MISPTIAKYPILVVDDEQDVVDSFEMALNAGGFNNVLTCTEGGSIPELLTQYKNIAVILLDLVMPNINGRDLLKQLKEEYPEIPIIVVTALYDLDIAVECIKNGAFDYLVKPVEKVRLTSSVQRAMDRTELTRENIALKQRLLTNRVERPEIFSKIITRNKAMLSIFKYVEAIGDSSEPVLITGETGVGKELIARAIHDLSGVSGPFIGVNIAGLDEQSFADTLFGHRRGAFTGADTNRQGLLKAAEGGTLFLDEIGDLSQTSQVKLLRLLQEQEYFPLGSDVPHKSNARILTATHHDLEEEISNSMFRRDLYFRLKIHQVHMPPLRERIEDIPLLVEVLLDKIATKLRKKKLKYSPKLVSILKCYNFPGNVRELEALLYDAVTKSTSGWVDLNSFNKLVNRDRAWRSPHSDVSELFSEIKNLPTLAEAIDSLVDEAFKRADGNQSIAANFLGISQSALSRRLKRRKDKDRDSVEEK
ncbi:MAG: sigma-54-dependent Fis family transcriptional regulator [Desulfuromonadales bacterium]|nr:sigma-54-dependent Fis family transcriptional regulator [Desulfuromonadales bacterium]MBN2792526.1 sigma-54-dependent Fis family transcriptional regulator [Desulfuromonadales bacterium]